jgi:DNA-binding beta-propeller fold protein YncE
VISFGCQARAGGRNATQEVPDQTVKHVAFVPLPGVEGRFDHFGVDVEGRRLFVAALGNNTLEAIDLATSQRAGMVKGLKKPTGIAYIPAVKQIAVASGDDGMCRFYESATLKETGSVRGLDDADNVRYDTNADKVYVGYGSGALAVIDPKTVKKVADIKLEAHPESFRLEEHGDRAFVNLPDARNSIAVVDRKKGAVVATWRLKEAGANFPVWLDESNQRLLVGCRKPAKLLVLDTNTGKTVAAVDCVGDTDDLFLDPATKRIYVSGGDGAISVIEQVDKDHYRNAGSVRTAPGARTSLFVPELSRLFLAVPHRGNQAAEIRIFETEAARR